MKLKYVVIVPFLMLLTQCNWGTPDVKPSILATDSLPIVQDTLWGIDMSHHQQGIDWDSLALKKPDFMFFKATEGITHQDHFYFDHRENAEKLGILVGAYHFFSYTTDGKLQARNYIRHAELKSGNIIPVLDAEYKRRMPEDKWVTEHIILWLNEVEKHYGVKPIIYCDCSYYDRYLKDKISSEYPLWVVDYFKSPICGWMFWQKTDQYRMTGFKGNVDYNVFNGSKADLNKLLLQ